MKINKLDNGYLVITTDDGTIKYLLPKEIVIKVNPDKSVPESILINSSTAFNTSGSNSIHVSLGSIVEIEGETFTGDISDLIVEISNLSAGVKLIDDYISVKIENEYEAFVNFANKKEVLLVRTDITGDLISKLYYKTAVADTSEFDTLWNNRNTSITYVNLVDL